MPGLHARPAAPRLPRRPRRADRGPLGADDRRHAVGRVLHGVGRRRRGRDLLGPRGRRRPVLRGVRRSRHARVLHARALPQARRRRRSSSTCSSSSTRARPRRRPRCSSRQRAARSRSRRWPRSHARRRRPRIATRARCTTCASSCRARWPTMSSSCSTTGASACNLVYLPGAARPEGDRLLVDLAREEALRRPERPARPRRGARGLDLRPGGRLPALRQMERAVREAGGLAGGRSRCGRR